MNKEGPLKASFAHVIIALQLSPKIGKKFAALELVEKVDK
jgi:hypothetical protein